MDIEKFWTLLLSLQGALLQSKEIYLRYDPVVYARTKQMIDIGPKLLPDHSSFFTLA